MANWGGSGGGPSSRSALLEDVMLRAGSSVALRSFLALTLLSPLGLAQVGSVFRAQKLTEGHRGFTGVLHDDDYFGYSLASPGDVNGDGVADLAVGAYLDDDGGHDRGAIWIVFLHASGRPLGMQKISSTAGGLGVPLQDNGFFGLRMAGIGDLDGDGVGELAVLHRGPNRLFVLFLGRSGKVKRHTRIDTTDPAFVPATLGRT